MALVEEVRYAQAFSFKYSPRPGTPAADAENQVDEAVKAARLQDLQALLNAQQMAFHQAQIGKTLPVLFDKLSKSGDQMSGRSLFATRPCAARGCRCSGFARAYFAG